MTIVTTVRCDAFGCANETEVESDFSSDVSAEGYREDPTRGGNHYCIDCWPTEMKELAGEEVDD